MEHISCCGADCTKCQDYRKSCNGCKETCGKVAWTQYVGVQVCPIYQCAILDNKYKSCAECSELPCKKIYDTKDPKMTDEEFRENIAERVDRLKNSYGNGEKINESK